MLFLILAVVTIGVGGTFFVARRKRKAAGALGQ